MENKQAKIVEIARSCKTTFSVVINMHKTENRVDMHYLLCTVYHVHITAKGAKQHYKTTQCTEKKLENYVISFCTKRKSAQRRRKHCTLAVVRQSQQFSPRRRPPSRGRGTAKIFSWRWSLSLPTDSVWWQFLVIMVTDPQTQTSTQTGPITIHCAAASARCN